VAALLRPYGFTLAGEIRELSPHIYLAIFAKTSPAHI
jgi:hypothetical protein